MSVAIPVAPLPDVDLVVAGRKLALGLKDRTVTATRATADLLTLRDAVKASAAVTSAARNRIGEPPARPIVDETAKPAVEPRSRAEIIAQASYNLVADAGAQDQIKALLRSA